MAYSPFDVSALPELGGMDSINLEEELKKISEKITGLEDVELDGIKGGSETAAGKELTKLEHTADDTSLQDDSLLELSLDSIIATHEHVTIEHESDGSTTVVSRGKKRVRISDAATVYSDGSGLATTPTKGSDAAAGEEIDTTDAKSAKRRRIDEPPSAETQGAEGGSTAQDGSGKDLSWTWGDAAEGDEQELSWSWGEGESETETDISHHQDPFVSEAERRRSALMAEIATVEDVELNEEEEKLSKALNGSLSAENAFEKPVIMRQRRVARLKKRIEVHRNKTKQVLAKWDISPSSQKRP